MSNPLLSIVTGTYNRLPYLKLLIASARVQLPKGIDTEFIIIDGGSTDGTIAWCKAQPDVRLIEDGELKGAISAFSRAAHTSQAEYVLLANDDVLFKPNSIIPAIVHLETHPECAAVAFADNRTSRVTGTGRDFRTEGIGCTLPDGTASMVTYAQVGMFRRELAEAAGWWGYEDDIMRHARTYGGDCYLSARLWEAGYTVEPVAGCVVEDLIVRDALRNAHASGLNGADSDCYYRRFPTVHIPAERAAYPIPERLRVLHLPVYEPTYPQAANTEPAWAEAFWKRGALCLEVDYLNTDTDLPALVKAWHPDLILTQIQGWGEKLTPQILADMRHAAPGALVVNWCGDATLEGLLSPPVLDLLQHVDLQTTVNAAPLAEYERLGIPAAYWQIGWKEPAGRLPSVPQWDVVYTANWYEYREPLFNMLHSLPKTIKFGNYGNDRRAVGNCHYDFAAQAALFKAATIVIGDTFPFGTEAFVSNRLFQVLSQGGFLLQQYSRNLDKYTGLIPGVHYAEWTDIDDLRQKIDYWLQPEQAAARRQIAEAGREFVRENFSFDAQVEKLLTELLPELVHGNTAPVGYLAELETADGIPR